jgi:hypothetical protein
MPANFDCNGSNITWTSNFVPGSISSVLRDTLFPYATQDLNELFNTNFLPDGDINLDFSDHIYPYNYQNNCSYNITLETEVYLLDLEIDLVTPYFISASHSIPDLSTGDPPPLWIKNPIIHTSYHDGACNIQPFPCPKANPIIIWDKKTGEYKETIGCCVGTPQENYCCNQDFLKKIENEEDYECFHIETQTRKFFGMTLNRDNFTIDRAIARIGDIDIHCNLNTVSDQYYKYVANIPVCMALPFYMTVNTYDIAIQGVCDRSPIASGSSEYCPPYFNDPDDLSIILDLSYTPQKTVVSKKAVKLTYYYCEVTYSECSNE